MFTKQAKTIGVLFEEGKHLHSSVLKRLVDVIRLITCVWNVVVSNEVNLENKTLKHFKFPCIKKFGSHYERKNSSFLLKSNGRKTGKKTRFACKNRNKMKLGQCVVTRHFL